jgi:rod shape-determining protein MreC
MRNFFRFIERYHFFLLFLLFETLALYLVINFNQLQHQAFISTSARVTSSVVEISGSLKNYFLLKKSNEELSRENAYLRSRLQAKPEAIPSGSFASRMDTSISDRYTFHQAKVINNSVNKQFNYLTLNRGAVHGVKPETGVISVRGLVGIVQNVSPHYCTVISLLNTNLKVSAKLRDSNYFGSLEWDGKSYRYATLSEIPVHAHVQVGEAIVTSGYSVIFPEGILVGIVEEINLAEGEGFYRIKVKLSVDFKNLTYVEVAEKLTRVEQLNLEKKTQND